MASATNANSITAVTVPWIVNPLIVMGHGLSTFRNGVKQYFTTKGEGKWTVLNYGCNALSWLNMARGGQALSTSLNALRPMQILFWVFIPPCYRETPPVKGQNLINRLRLLVVARNLKKIKRNLFSRTGLNNDVRHNNFLSAVDSYPSTVADRGFCTESRSAPFTSINRNFRVQRSSAQSAAVTGRGGGYISAPVLFNPRLSTPTNRRKRR